MLAFLLTSDYLASLALDTDPIGWDALRYVWARDEALHGVMMEVSSRLTFIKKGAAYLRRMYSEFGPDALVILSVFEYDPNEFRYFRIYRGRVDFSTRRDTEKGYEATIIESTFAAQLANRRDQPIDLLGHESLGGVPIPPAPVEYVRLHSQQTLKRYEARQAETPTEFLPITGYNVVLVRIGFPDLDPAVNEFPAPLGYGLYQGDFGAAANTPTLPIEEAGFYEIEFAFTHQVNMQVSSLGSFKVRLIYRLVIKRQGFPDDARQISYYEEDFGAAVPQPRLFSHTSPVSRIAIAEQFQVGDSVTLSAVLAFEGGSSAAAAKWSSRYLAGSYFKAKAVTTTPATYAPGILVHEALEHCAAAVTDQPRPFYSDYYGRAGLRPTYLQDGPGSLRMVTSGFQLRGFPLTTAPGPAAGTTDTRKTITTSFGDLYQGLDAIDCLGLGIELLNGRQRVRVEPRSFFYQDKEVLRLGSVTDLAEVVRPESLHNAAEVGYQRWQSGTQNGLDEFNGKRTYSLPLSVVKNTYSAVSSTLNASGYLIEQARRDRYEEGTSKEGSADAENFIICLKRVPAYNEVIFGATLYHPPGYASERNERYQFVSGILSPSTTYNLTISPGRMLEKHEPWLHTGLRQQDRRRMLLSKVEGNTGLKSQFYGEPMVLDESASIAVSDLAPAILAEFDYEFTVGLRRWQMAALQANPYGYISFLNGKGQRRKGYLRAAERTPDTGLTSFTLYAIPV